MKFNKFFLEYIFTEKFFYMSTWFSQCSISCHAHIMTIHTCRMPHSFLCIYAHLIYCLTSTSFRNSPSIAWTHTALITLNSNVTLALV